MKCHCYVHLSLLEMIIRAAIPGEVGGENEYVLRCSFSFNPFLLCAGVTLALSPVLRAAVLALAMLNSLPRRQRLLSTLHVTSQTPKKEKKNESKLRTTSPMSQIMGIERKPECAVVFQDQIKGKNKWAK